MNLSPEIITLLTLDIIFLFFGIVALVLSLRISFKWNAASTASLQYILVKQSSLVSVIIKYIFMLKMPLFLFFIFTNDKLSAVITGAMCATGVINSVSFGMFLTLFKLLNLYLFGFWLFLNHADLSDEALPFTRLKFSLFCLFSIPLFVEIALEIGFFSSLNISKIVSCCGALFSATSDSYVSLLFLVDSRLWAGLFLAFFALAGIAYYFRQIPLFIVSNGLFLLMALIALMSFFSPYIYELPTHRCLFCILQKEYFFIGYFLYSFLFLGTFYGMGGGAMALLAQSKTTTFMRRSLFFNALYVGILLFYVGRYLLLNGVWL